MIDPGLFLQASRLLRPSLILVVFFSSKKVNNPKKGRKKTQDPQVEEKGQEGL